MVESFRAAYLFARRMAVAALLVVSALVVLGPRHALADVQYFYDEAGRLTQVVDQNGDAAQYVYDAAGNIVQIVRVAAGSVSISGFTPTSGPVGGSVTIYGTGFSTTPANDAVQFNGTAATVNTASANQLVVLVPTGATTGTISVTVGTQTATSVDSFTVTTGIPGAPTITGFTPGGGSYGTTVTISGTNFDPVATNDIVRFNDVAQAAVSSASTTQIVTSVPGYAGSGHISVRTPYGIAVSTDDFIVAPSGYAYADIIAVTRVAVGGAGSLNISTANKHGMLLFDGAAGDYLSLQLTALAISPSGSVSYKVFDPTKAQVLTGTVSSTSMSIHLPVLARTGTYSVIFSPGAATANLSFSVTRDPVISAAQPTLDASVAVAGQSVRGIYAGTTGTSMTLRLTAAATTPADQTINLTVLNPDGTQLAASSGSPSTDGGVLNVDSLPTSGNYSVLIVPANAATGTISVTLNPAMDITIDGSSIGVSTSTTGYAKTVLFTGTAGQEVNVALSSLVYSPTSGNSGTVWLYKPDGSQLAVMSNCYTSAVNCAQLVATLPTSGTYSVKIAPPSNARLSSATLSILTPITGTLADATPFNLNMSRTGDFAHLTFSGTAGQPAVLHLGIGSSTPNPTVNLSVIAPDGTTLFNGYSTASDDGVVFATASLPATGTYTVYVIPWVLSTGTMSVTLNPPMDLTIDGTAIGVSTSAPGYAKRIFFAGTAGQEVNVQLNSLVYSPASGNSGTVWLYKPDGSQLAVMSNCYTSAVNCAQLVATLPTSGTYSVKIASPSNASLSSSSLSILTPVTGILADATPFSLNLSRAGNYAHLTFSGTAGQALTLHLGIGSSTPNANVSLSIHNPDGTSLFSNYSSASDDGVVFATASLPATGTYTVYVIPWVGSTGTMTVKLNPAMDITIDGSSIGVSTGAPGYAKRYFFSGTAGQEINVALSSLVFSPASGNSGTVWLYKPDGSQLAVMSNCYTASVNCAQLIATLPTSGTYGVKIAGPSNSALSGTLSVLTPVTGTLADATPFSLNLSRAGNYAHLTFSGTAGQAVTMHLGIGSSTPNPTVNLSVKAPDGTALFNGYDTASNDGVVFYSANLPATGTYTVYVIPWALSTGTMVTTLNPPMDLTIDGPSSAIPTTTAGYAKRYFFNVPINHRVGIGVTNIVHTPSSGAATTISTLKPDGSTSTSTNCYTSGLARCEWSFNTVTGGPAGTYTLLVRPPSGVNFSGTVTLSNHLAGSLTVGGGAVPVALDRDGQDGLFTFPCTSGQTLRLSVTGMSTNPSGQQVNIYVERPDYSVLASYAPSAQSSTLDIPTLNVSGTCNVYMSPWYGVQADMNIAVDPR